MTNYLKITFFQSSPFSLRVSEATAKLGKSHLCPTPHCIKSALIDRYAETNTENELIAFLKLIDRLSFSFLLPDLIIVNQTFYKKMKPARDDAESEDAYTSTIMYQEYVHYPEFSLLIDVTNLTEDECQVLIHTFVKINYLGKKDSLISYKEHSFVLELPKNAIKPLSITKDPNGMVIRMDDFYHNRKNNSEKIYLNDLRIGGGYGNSHLRDFIAYLFPYQIKSSCKKYTLYEVLI